MAEQILSETVLIYGFALFFIFSVGMWLVIKYSNKDLSKKFINVYDRIVHNEKDLRKLAETDMRERSEIKQELEELREELTQIKNNFSVQKRKIPAH